MTDDKLIAEALRGNTRAYGELVTRYQNRLFGSVFRMVHQPEDALDVVQESLINAYENLASFKGESLFFTWLYRIAVNTAITMRRKKRIVLSIHAGEFENKVNEPQDLSETSRPGFNMEQSEQEQRINQALNTLSPEYRLVLIMKDMDGMKYEDIAEVMNVPIGTIRSRLHRARLELRNWLESDEV